MESQQDQEDSMEVVEVAPPAEKEKKKEKQGNKAYHWCFTLNNPKQPDGQKFLELVTDPDEGWGVEYLVFQLERGKKEKTPHYQGYCEFTKAERMTSIKKKGHEADRCHWEKRKGTPAQARDYCMKAEGRVSLTYIYHAGLDFPPRWEEMEPSPDRRAEPREDDVPEVSWDQELEEGEVRHGFERRWNAPEDEDAVSEPELWGSFHEGEDGYATPPTQ